MAAEVRPVGRPRPVRCESCRALLPQGERTGALVRVVAAGEVLSGRRRILCFFAVRDLLKFGSQ